MEVPEWVSELSEDQQTEIQVLQAIFLENFGFQNENKSFHIVVVPSFGGAFQNLCSIRLTIRFPQKYPYVPLDDMKLECTEGPISAEWLRESRSLLLQKSRELIGGQMVYALIEQLKDYLEHYNEDIKHGYFGMLSDEVIYRVFEFLYPEDLSRASMVNKNLNRLANDATLWEGFCMSRLGADEYKSICENSAAIPTKTQISEDSKQKLFWRRCYNLTKNSITQDIPFSYGAAIMERKNTGDTWSASLTPQQENEWQTRFAYLLQARYGIILRKNGLIGLRSCNKVGTYLFKGSSFAKKYADLEWVKAIEGLRACPYLGNLIGFIFWTVDKTEHAELLISAMAQASRGIVTQLMDTSKFEQCVTLRKYPLTTVMDPTQYGSNILLLSWEPYWNYITDLKGEVNNVLKLERYKRTRTTTQELPVANENRSTGQAKIKQKKGKPDPEPSSFDWMLNSPKVSGTEHIEYASTYEKIEIGIWCVPPTLYEQDLPKLLLHKDRPPKNENV